MNILIDRCPEFVELNGEQHQISSDHRTSILFELAMKDKSLNSMQLYEVGLNLYFGDEGLKILYGDNLEILEDAIDAMLWFFSMGRVMNNEELTEGQDISGKPSQPLYSFEHDSEYIYVSFMTAYNIDLNEVDYLHWWKFRALFNSLPEDTVMKEIMSIRGSRISRDMSNDEKKRIRKLKSIYALPSEVSVKSDNDSLGNAMEGLF